MSLSVVLIEPHAAMRQGLEVLLPQEDVVVEGAAAGVEEGMALIREWEPDVVVVDVLSGESGPELVDRILRAHPRERIVLYTGRDEVHAARRALDAGAQGIALKEAAIEELVQAVTCVASGGTYVDPRLRPALLSDETRGRGARLSRREREVVDLLAHGCTGEEIADQLFVSSETVKTHVRNAVAKLEARSRTHAVAIALQEGLITMRPPALR